MARPAPAQRRERILVVDDDQSIRDMLSDTLTDEGFDVATAASTASALSAAEAEPPDLILLDMRMPDDGPVFYAALKRRSLQAEVIAMSASDKADLWAHALGVRFIAKPFLLDTVLAALHTAIDERPNGS